jgi:diaminopimelate epimerase
MQVDVVKGHGTRNDFVLIPDPNDEWGDALTPEVRALLCDRRSGLGGDGSIRVVPVERVVDAGDQGKARWFMDYRNADGSLAEMCGNGARVFARYLVDQGWETGPSFVIGTRGGPVPVEVRGGGLIAIGMARPDLLAPVTVQVRERTWPATTLTIPNPHAVAFVDDLDDVDREERQALRRVARPVDRAQDVTEVEYRQVRLERVVLVGVWTDGTLDDAERVAGRARGAGRDRGVGGARRR